jgi:hypothetical protein
MQFRMKLAAMTAGVAVALIAAAPAGAATAPSWVTGREVVHGSLHGHAAWVQATRRTTRVPVWFRGVVATHGTVSLGGGHSRNASIWTPAGRFAVRFIRTRNHSHLNRRRCRVTSTTTVLLRMHGDHSTGVFRGATGRGAVVVRFAFNFRKHHGSCSITRHSVPSRRGGVISFRLVVPRLSVR